MSPRAQGCRLIVLAYLGFIMVLTAIQLYQGFSWPERFPVSFGLVLRLVILGLLVERLLTKPRPWSMVLGMLFLAGAVVIPLRFYLIHSSRPVLMVVVVGRMISRTTTMWLFCLVPFACAVCCFALWRMLAPKGQNHTPELAPQPGAGTS